MDVDWSSIGALAAILGGVILRDRQVFKAITEGDAKLHERITIVQKEYVRRDDLTNHIRQIENSVNMIHAEQQATNARIDVVLLELKNHR